MSGKEVAAAEEEVVTAERENYSARRAYALAVNQACRDIGIPMYETGNIGKVGKDKS